MAARAGVPAHVTILVPFVPPQEIDPALVERLRALFAPVRAFEFTLARVERWEPGIVWLAPEPDAPFRALTQAVEATWPEHPGYGGEHDENIPHLTVTQDVDDATVERVTEAVRVELPIRARAKSVELWTEDESGRWACLERFPLRR